MELTCEHHLKFGSFISVLSRSFCWNKSWVPWSTRPRIFIKRENKDSEMFIFFDAHRAKLPNANCHQEGIIAQSWWAHSVSKTMSYEKVCYFDFWLAYYISLLSLPWYQSYWSILQLQLHPLSFQVSHKLDTQGALYSCLEW